MSNKQPFYKNINLPFLRVGDLQMFAGDGGTQGTDPNGGTDSNGGGNPPPSDDNKGGKEDKTFTQEDLNKIISDRLSKERKKWDEEFQAKVEEAKTEAQKLAKMNAEQKAEYERKQLEEQLNKREAEITRRELRATALETLAEKSLPKQLADILDYTDADSTNKSIEAVEKSFREAVEQAVNERLKGDPPKTGSGGKASALEKEISKFFE